MRKLVCAIVGLGAIALFSGPVAADEAAAGPKAPQAASAQQRGVPAAYRGPAVGHGYSAEARRRADCLATYAGYDPKIDRIRTDSGATRRCAL